MALGYYRPLDGTEPGSWLDNDLFAGIKNFQHDNRLKVDGLMRPEGLTACAMNAELHSDREKAAAMCVRLIAALKKTKAIVIGFSPRTRETVAGFVGRGREPSAGRRLMKDMLHVLRVVQCLRC